MIREVHVYGPALGIGVGQRRRGAAPGPGPAAGGRGARAGPRRRLRPPGGHLGHRHAALLRVARLRAWRAVHDRGFGRQRYNGRVGSLAIRSCLRVLRVSAEFLWRQRNRFTFSHPSSCAVSRPATVCGSRPCASTRWLPRTASPQTGTWCTWAAGPWAAPAW